MSFRIKKINELLRKKIGRLILEELDFPKNLVITVTRVETSPDLRHAKVMLSLMPSSKKDYFLKKLNLSAHKIQKNLNKELRMKYIPKIEFKIDKIEERASRIEELIQQIKQENKNC